MIIIMLCAFFSSHSFALGLSSVAFSHILSAVAHLLLHHGSGMVIIMLCAFFSSPIFAPGLSSVAFSQQCHISCCLITEVAW
jgi:hypothetical protein